MAKGGIRLIFKGATYLLIVHYYLHYPEIIKLSPDSILRALRSIFSRLGIPEVLISDNGPQYASEVMKDFAKSYGFEHITNSPITRKAMLWLKELSRLSRLC